MIIDCIMKTMRFRMLCNHLQGWIYWGDLSTVALQIMVSELFNSQCIIKVRHSAIHWFYSLCIVN